MEQGFLLIGHWHLSLEGRTKKTGLHSVVRGALSSGTVTRTERNGQSSLLSYYSYYFFYC